MNVAFFLRPKFQVSYIFENDSIREGLEKMRHHGYTSIPVLNDKNEYVGTVSEGDFLWYLIEDSDEIQKVYIKNVEGARISEILKPDKVPSIRITANMEELLTLAMKQNFVPVVDDSNVFIGIVTRKTIIEYLMKKKDVSHDS